LDQNDWPKKFDGLTWRKFLKTKISDIGLETTSKRFQAGAPRPSPPSNGAMVRPQLTKFDTSIFIIIFHSENGPLEGLASDTSKSYCCFMFIENLHEYPVLSPAATSPTSCTAAVTVALQFSFAGLCIYIILY
jgi:hypothetical protein